MALIIDDLIAYEEMEGASEESIGSLDDRRTHGDDMGEISWRNLHDESINNESPEKSGDLFTENTEMSYDEEVKSETIIGDDIPESQVDIQDILNSVRNEADYFVDRVDDNGKVYRKDGKLLPNETYTLNGNVYYTDDQGRIVKVEAQVEVNNDERPGLSGKSVEDKKETDDKGHLIAHTLGGSSDEGNLVAMDSNLNRGPYKSMETEAKKASEEGKQVNMTVEVEYEGDSKRPVSFTVTLEIDGEVTVKKFYN